MPAPPMRPRMARCAADMLPSYLRKCVTARLPLGQCVKREAGRKCVNTGSQHHESRIERTSSCSHRMKGANFVGAAEPHASE